MKAFHITLLAGFAAVLAASVPAPGKNTDQQDIPLPPEGSLQTMPHGTYDCALPGDAAGDAYRVVASEEFRIATASRYASPEGIGTYIMRGRELVFTRGPKNGERFRRVGDNQLRKLDANGSGTDLLCTRRGSP